MLRSSILGIGLAVAAVVASIQVSGCGDSGGGGGAGSTGSAGSSGTAGSTGAGGTSSGVGGTTGGGGTSTGTGGSSTTGTAGTSATGTAGTTGGGGATGTAGTTGAFGQPACLGTVTKGGACAATDQQLCYKTCGPGSKGVKSETCTNAVYVEMDGCSFDPSMDYSCYKLPTTANAMCPAAATPPQAGQACTVDMCNPCNSTGGLAGGKYKDSGGAEKTGWCVCQAPNGAGNRTWTCASDVAWPCTATGGSPGCI
jgi:hypothetical protein